MFLFPPNNTFTGCSPPLPCCPPLSWCSSPLSRAPWLVVSWIYRGSHIWLFQGHICKLTSAPPSNTSHLYALGPSRFLPLSLASLFGHHEPAHGSSLPAHGLFRITASPSSSVAAVVFWYFIVLMLFFWYFFATFCVLLLILCCLGYCFPTLMWIDLLVETFVADVCSFPIVHIRFLVVLPLQQPLNGGYCLYHLGIQMEPVCPCLPFRAALREAPDSFWIEQW